MTGGGWLHLFSLISVLSVQCSAPHCTINPAVLTEAEEECINTYGIDVEEAMSNQVGTYHHRLM